MTRREFVASALSVYAAGGFSGCLVAPPPAIDERRMSELIDEQIRDGLITCSACGSASGATFCRGNRLPLASTPVAVDAKSIFEIASVSKLFTATLVALLYSEGKLDIDAPFVEYLPDHALAKSGTDITVRDLATHTSGFDNSWMGKSGVYGSRFPFASDAEYRQALLKALPTTKRGERYCYACHNFILLGFIVERITGFDLDAAAKKYVWDPLGMHDTSWKECVDMARCAQIYTKGPRPLGMKGDENARGLKMPIGNAGVFSTLDDLRLFAGDILDRRAFPSTVYELFYKSTAEFANGRRTFGWNSSPDGIPQGWSDQTIFHTGFTGSLIAVDPETCKAGVVLTNLIPFESAKRKPAYAVRRQLLSLVCA